tara:strand:+ start:27227 stop:28024 length:798 start_codon:yes stop_codon:yes gene_type:complete
MNGLMLDTPDSGLATRHDIDLVSLPNRTRTYTPVPHGEVVDIVETEAQNMGLTVKNPVFGLARKGQQLFGAFEVVGQDHLGGEVQLMLGFRNSYDKSLSLGVCFGAKVFVCSNLCFSGYAGEEGVAGSISQKHTTFVYEKVMDKLHAGLSQFGIFRDAQEKFFGRLGEAKLDDDKAYATIVRAAQADAIRNADILDVAKVWNYQEHRPETEETPDDWHTEFQPRNAWSLFNCFTEAQKIDQRKNSFYHASNRSLRLTKFFQAEFN